MQWQHLCFLILVPQRMVNEKCRKLSKHVAFYAVNCRDSCGEIFVDLQNYAYSKVIYQLSLFFSFLLVQYLDPFMLYSVLSVQFSYILTEPQCGWRRRFEFFLFGRKNLMPLLNANYSIPVLRYDIITEFSFPL